MDTLTSLYQQKIGRLTHEALVYQATALDLQEEVKNLKEEVENLRKELEPKEVETEKIEEGENNDR